MAVKRKRCAAGTNEEEEPKCSKDNSELFIGASDAQLLAEVKRRGLEVDVNDETLTTVVQTNIDENYETSELLGQGSSASVYKVTQKCTGDHFAMKVIKKHDGGFNDTVGIDAELAILKGLRHRNLVNLYECHDSPSTLWLIMELIEGGDLRQIVKECSHFSEANICDVAKQVCTGLHYIHSSGIVHRDIKPENVLRVSKKGGSILKIADFGLSARLPSFKRHEFHPDESTKMKANTSLKETWGTPQYFAPELLRGQYGTQVDMWALGCMLYELLTGHLLFPQKDEDELFAAQAKGLPQDVFTADKWAGQITCEAQDFLEGLMRVDPTKRLSASGALKHPWLQHGSAVPTAHLHSAHERFKALEGAGPAPDAPKYWQRGNSCVVS